MTSQLRLQPFDDQSHSHARQSPLFHHPRTLRAGPAEQASLEQVEAFWDANDETYFGLRIEDAQSEHARVYVTDEIPEDEELALP